MLHVRALMEDAEVVKKVLVIHKILDKERLVQHDRKYVYFPIYNIDKANIKKLLKGRDYSIIDMKDRKEGTQKYYELLEEALGDEIKDFDTGYDVLGNIAIINPPKGMIKAKVKRFAGCVIEANRAISTVLAKGGPVEGVYRTRKLSYIAGKRTFVANYRENGCSFTFDPRKTFFSNRLSFERGRVAQLARNRKNIVVMFAGIGPFAIEIAKSNPEANVIGIELNPYSYKSMKENIALNRVKNVAPVLGDVKKVYKKYRKFADLVVMPLPKMSLDFLDEAYQVARDGCVVCLYAFVRIERGNEELVKAIRQHALENSYKVRIKFKRRVRAYSATEEETVIDYMIRR